MIKTLSTHDVAHELSSNKDNGFSYQGALALAEYFEELENSTGEPIELDTVAIRCEYSEYTSAYEAASNYFDYPGMVYDENGDETMTADEVETSALEYLQDKTQAIIFDGGVIILQF